MHPHSEQVCVRAQSIILRGMGVKKNSDGIMSALAAARRNAQATDNLMSRILAPHLLCSCNQF
jgi:hypothetical protein